MIGRGRSGAALRPREHTALALLLAGSAGVLVVLAAAGLVTERSSGAQLVAAARPAPEFTLPAARGGAVSLGGARGGPVVLAFVPSVLCARCRAQLRALQEALAALRARGPIAVLAVSTDTAAVQRATAEDLGLDFPLLSEAPTVGKHPAGSAYGVYHYTAAPVDANAVIVIDAAGTVRGVRVRPDEVMSETEIVTLVNGALGPDGGGG